MRHVIKDRITATHDGDFVVFLLGTRANVPWRPLSALRVLIGFVRMLRWLDRNPQEGLLHASFAWMNGGPAAVQYWESYDALEHFARQREAPHLPVWQWYRKAVEGGGTAGIWHETYLVAPGTWECIYVDMPLSGLPQATAHTPISAARNRSRARVAGADA